MKLHAIGSALLLALTTAACLAHQYTLGTVEIEHPHATATGPGQSSGTAYFTLVNRGADDRLTSASAGVAKSVEIHAMRMDGDVMRMRPVDGIDLPAGQTVALTSGGFHVMLIGLKAPLKPGTAFPMSLRFEKAGTIQVQVHIEAVGAR
jgi:copper(I)-binding protein